MTHLRFVLGITNDSDRGFPCLRSLLIFVVFLMFFFSFWGLCLGFWSGFIVFAIGSSHYHLLPLASAGVSWIADIFNNILQSIEYFMDKKNNYEPKNPK